MAQRFVFATDVANAGVSLLTESLAKELALVRANVVAPYYAGKQRIHHSTTL
ncbi:hypothetical protein [Acaryochloris thomasi]|nr:hypothetical protein [Acaryochloris thomasi]